MKQIDALTPTEALKTDDGKLHHREVSPTAATAYKRLYGPSGAIKYLVVLANGDVRTGKVVEASTGDEAAEKGLALNGGGKVVYVGPAVDGVDMNRLADQVSE